MLPNQFQPMQTYWCVSISSIPPEELYQILLVLSPAYLPSARCFYEDPAARMYGLWYMDTKWIGSLQMDQENCLTLADVAPESPRRKAGKDSSPSVASGRILSLWASYALQKRFCSRKCRFYINAGLISLLFLFLEAHRSGHWFCVHLNSSVGRFPQGPVPPGTHTLNCMMPPGCCDLVTEACHFRRWQSHPSGHTPRGDPQPCKVTAVK